MRPSFLFASPPPQIAHKRSEAGKTIARVHVMLDHIKREIIKATETPDGERQQQSNFQRRRFDHQQS
ncbi:MAG: hypothetical protein QOD03_662 [Verrucomicrobiota bacterium]